VYISVLAIVWIVWLEREIFAQVVEYLFHKGLIDSIVPHNLLKGVVTVLKGVVTELFQFHNFFSLTKKERNYEGKKL